MDPKNFVFVSILSHEGDNVIPHSTARTLIAVTGVTICLVVLIKWYFSGGVCKSKARLDGKIHNGLIAFQFSLHRLTASYTDFEKGYIIIIAVMFR